MKIRNIPLLLYLITFVWMSSSFAQQPGVRSWISKADGSALLEVQPIQLFGKNDGRHFPIVVDGRQTFQEIDGFGFALTGGSAELLHKMHPSSRSALLKELFDKGTNDVSISYLRLSIGASDLNRFVYSYNDLEDGETDIDLKKFSLGHDYDDIIPVLKEILAINPTLKIMASPWSAPTWMKTSGKVQGGSLKPEYYAVYAKYLLRYVQEMKNEGIVIDAITVQNEPLNSRNTPSMPITVPEMRIFLRDHLGPLFDKNAPETKIVLFDHNCDRPDYPLALLNDMELDRYVDGSGFHHYGGDISTMSLVHQARPDKNIYFTEQMVIQNSDVPIMNIAYQVERLVIGTMRNWSKNLILWNLAADPNNDPHTDNGGCSICQGALTLDGDAVSKNVAFHVIAQASKFVPPGSVRIQSNGPFDAVVNLTTDEEKAEITRAISIAQGNVLPNVAFKTPEGKIVLIVANSSFTDRSVKIQYQGRFVNLPLAAGAIATYVWPI